MNVIPLSSKKIETIEQMVDEIHRQFATAADGTKKADRARIRAGQLLIALRRRIEAGEVGEGVNWWKWYEENFARSKRDARKVMKLASAEDPEAAYDEEKKKRREGKRGPMGPQPEDEDFVIHVLRLVEEMDAEQRKQFFAELRRLYAYQH